MKNTLLFPMQNNAIYPSRKLAFTFLLSIIMAFNAVATDYFVAVGGVDTNNGLSWTTPYLTVTKALSVAAGTGVNNRIFVKQGTYTMTATAYTFINSSITLQGGFPTAATGTDISGYSQANTTTLDYNFNSTTSSNGTVVVQNTGAGPYTVIIKGFTVTDMGGATTIFSDFFIADAANTANTTFSFSDMTHTLTPPIALNSNEGVNSIYDLENILASNTISFTNCNFQNLRVMGSNFGAITIRNSAVAATLTTCTFDKTSNVGTAGIIFLENISASPIINVAADNKFINAASAINASRYANYFVLFKNTGDFVIDGLTNPVDNNQAGGTLPGTFVRAWGSTNGASTTLVGQAQANPGKITIKNITFTNTAEGGVIAIASFGGRGDVEISNNVFTNNANTNGVGGGVILFQGVLPAVTTGIPSITISGNTFTGNGDNVIDGGAIGIVGNGQMLKYNNINLNNNTFTGNNAARGGGIFISQAVATRIKITNSSFTSNVAVTEGGAIDLPNVDAPKDLVGNTFCGNRVSSAGEGGAIHHSLTALSTADFPLNISNSIFNANESSFGSAIYLTSVSSFHLNTSTFSENAASNSTTVFVNDLLFQSDIDSCVFVRNVSLTGTAGIQISASSKIFHITKSNFTGNFTSNGTAGAIIFSESTALASTIVDCLFDGNATADGIVGAITLNSAPIATSLLDILNSNCLYYRVRVRTLQ